MTEANLTSPQHPTMRRLHRHWESLRQDGETIPAASRLDPIDMPWILPSIALIDRPNGELRLRLIGTGLVALLGGDMTGKLLREFLDPDALAFWTARFAVPFDERRPAFGREGLFWLNREHRTFEWISLPFAGPDGATSVAMCSAAFDH